ncbi:oligopeptide transporter [Pseudomassariella vexata]|uniref:Oligopeptide transporter n=1 Tax=Pseudomassariella vexata TaxID=1141098 RepID=A0A1Y2DJJ3_9PEZI|nr:oligopeptide transporter [Pseudomassariella vexata]ORY59326.1 oligopeptide transporter [Pseudomassariella vexata]
MSEQDLPAVRGHVPYRVWVVQGLYFLEIAASYGLSQVLQNYLQLFPDDPVRPGALGLGEARAVLIIYIWFIYSYSTPLVGGLVADCWLGRRKTIQVGFLIYILGLGIITGTAFSQRIYGTGGLPGFIVGMFLVGAGTGTVKPNITVFLIDQFPEEEPKVVVLKNGKSAVVSRELTIRFIWNSNYWYNRMINVGGLCGIITTNVEKYAGFGFTFLICLCLIVASAAIFQAGYMKFETAPPSGNAIANLFNALRRRRDPGHRNPDQTEVVRQPAAQQDDSATPNKDEAIIAEAKSALRACLPSFPSSNALHKFMDSTLIAQAGTMQTHGLPNDIMYNLNPISVMVFLPFFQSWIYPTLAKRKINFSAEHRIGVGLFCAALAIGYTTGIQHLIYITGPCFSHPRKCLAGNMPNDVTVGLQTPPYVFLGWAEILAIVSGTELAYSRAPANMKSIVQALFNLFSALGSVLGVGVSFAAYDPNMVIVYGSITGLLLFVTFAFELAYLLRGKASS